MIMVTRYLEPDVGRLGHGDVIPGEAHHGPVPDAGDVDDPGPALGGPQPLQQQVSQQKVTQVISLQLSLLTSVVTNSKI